MRYLLLSALTTFGCGGPAEEPTDQTGEAVTSNLVMITPPPGAGSGLNTNPGATLTCLGQKLIGELDVGQVCLELEAGRPNVISGMPVSGHVCEVDCPTLVNDYMPRIRYRRDTWSQPGGGWYSFYENCRLQVRAARPGCF
jgi:hypothetical protein